MTTDRPAQRQLVEQRLDWRLVEERLARYPAVASAFPLDVLRNQAASASAPPEAPPLGPGRGPMRSPPGSGFEAATFYAHYVAWRLGTWHNDQLFDRFDELLSVAASLPGWHLEHSLTTTAEYGDFWSLYWQLQVAEYLVATGFRVSWNGSGPDLLAERDGEKLYVECYSYRKRFHIGLFLEDIVSQVDDKLGVHYPLCCPMGAIDDSKVDAIIDKALQPLLDDRLVRAREQCATTWPVILSKPFGTLSIYLDGADEDMDRYDGTVLDGRSGAPEEYLRLALKEGLLAKASKNSLASHSPNLVAVSYLLSQDFQDAVEACSTRGIPLPAPRLPAGVDAFAFAAVGIDERLSAESFHLAAVNSAAHPAHRICSVAV